MRADQVTTLVLELGCLRDFPSWNQAAVEKISEQVAAMCKSLSEVKRLVDEMTRGRFDRWEGPATLKNVYEELYPPKREYDPGWTQYMPTPPECGVCCDTGAVRGDGDWGRCSCEAGRTVDQSYIDELQALLVRGRALQSKARQHNGRAAQRLQMKRAAEIKIPGVTQ